MRRKRKIEQGVAQTGKAVIVIQTNKGSIEKRRIAVGVRSTSTVSTR